MKKGSVLIINLFLLLPVVGCRLQRTNETAPLHTTVKIIRHSDLPIEFSVKTRKRETQRFLSLLNRYRARKGLPSLMIDKKLQRAAQWMSDDMAAKDYLGHRDSKGRDPFKRMGAFGYRFNTDKAENVAAGQKTADDVLKSWQSSKGHNRNMLDPHFSVIGIGFSYGKKSRYGWYWATSFGGKKSR